jgi:riboflavin synthase
MFTGIISDTTTLRLTKRDESGVTLTFDRPASWTDLQVGDSINTNGVCLSVAAVRDTEYDCVLVPETLARTSFGKKLPKKVNLERALQFNSRLDGHVVQGHVDGVGEVAAIEQSDGYRLRVTFDPENRNLVIQKGSISIDGVSLTIAAVTKGSVSVALIPHTLEHTTFQELKVGDLVNLEFDIIGKYVQGGMSPILPNQT